MLYSIFDDFARDWESNALNWFIDFKHKYPFLKVTLFTILYRWNIDVLKQLKKLDFLEFAAHGYTHSINSEVLDWDRKKWYNVLNKYEQTGVFVKVFKAPNWEMTDLGYHILHDMGWAVACRKEQVKKIPIGMKYYCFETNMFAVHGHTWLMKAHMDEGKFNGWHKGTQFGFVSDNLEEK